MTVLNLQPGDAVMCQFIGRSKQFAVVEKVTPKGNIYTRRWNKTQRKWGNPKSEGIGRGIIRRATHQDGIRDGVILATCPVLGVKLAEQS